MDRTDNIIDLARHRTRRQARRQAELMWMLYAQRAGYDAFQIVQQSRDSGRRDPDADHGDTVWMVAAVSAVLT